MSSNQLPLITTAELLMPTQLFGSTLDTTSSTIYKAPTLLLLLLLLYSANAVAAAAAAALTADIRADCEAGAMTPLDLSAQSYTYLL
jgi:hypothetical protein